MAGERALTVSKSTGRAHGLGAVGRGQWAVGWRANANANARPPNAMYGSCSHGVSQPGDALQAAADNDGSKRLALPHAG